MKKEERVDERTICSHFYSSVESNKVLQKATREVISRAYLNK